MSGWNEVNLAEVTPSFDVIPAGDYTVEVVGASWKEDGSGFRDIAVNGAIAEGDFSGRRVFLDYPDPSRTYTKNGELKTLGWSVAALKRLEQALGIAQEPGEDLVDMVNRGRGNRIKVPVRVDIWGENGENKKNKSNVLKVGIAA